MTPMADARGQARPAQAVTFDPITGRQTGVLPTTIGTDAVLHAPSTFDLTRFVLFTAVGALVSDALGGEIKRLASDYVGELQNRLADDETGENASASE